MKSIKEKGEDYVSGFHPSIQKMCKESFKAGAKYVLDAIEDVLSHPRRFVSDDISISEAMIVEITKIVEQLK